MFEDKTNIGEETKKALLRLLSVKNVPLDILEKESSIDKLRKDIEQKIKQEECTYDLFTYRERDPYKAEQCTGSIMAYKKIIQFIDKYKRKEMEDLEEAAWYILTRIKEIKEREK